MSTISKHAQSLLLKLQSRYDNDPTKLFKAFADKKGADDKLRPLDFVKMLNAADDGWLPSRISNTFRGANVARAMDASGEHRTKGQPEVDVAEFTSFMRGLSGR